MQSVLTDENKNSEDYVGNIPYPGLMFDDT